MTASMRLACDVCGHEFLVDPPVYRARCGVVECPRCGSTDLVLLDPGGDTGPCAAVSATLAGGQTSDRSLSVLERHDHHGDGAVM
jgi:hypothetical protein